MRISTEIAEKRLAAIREYVEFGSGFKIAMRDLELRGAGNIMGAQQHGHMDSVVCNIHEANWFNFSRKWRYPV